MTKPSNAWIADALDGMRSAHPLVHNITNYVVMNVTANALLAGGASPVMAHAPEEMEEMVGLAGGLVLNIGTLSAPWIEGMTRAASAARRLHRPVVLDPVGAGATRYRTLTARRLLDEAKPAVVRGNASEIMALAGEGGGARGVDAADAVEAAREAADRLAREHACVVAVTGAVDEVSDGERACFVHNGHPRMATVTGSGCTATALIAAFLAAQPDDPLHAATAALVFLGLAGERAAARSEGPGSFQVALLDALAAVDRPAVLAGARVRETP